MTILSYIFITLVLFLGGRVFLSVIAYIPWRYLPIAVPIVLRKRISLTGAWIISGIAYLELGSSSLFKYAVVISVVGCAVQLLKLNVYTVLCTVTLHRLLRSFRADPQCRPLNPYILIHGYTQLGGFSELAQSLSFGLFKLGAASTLKANRLRDAVNEIDRRMCLQPQTRPFQYLRWLFFLCAHPLIPPGLLTTADLKLHSAFFREYVHKHASVLVAFPPLGGQLLLTLLGFDQNPDLLDEETKRKLRRKWVVRLRRKVLFYEEGLLRDMHRTLGPALVVLPKQVELATSFMEMKSELPGYELASFSYFDPIRPSFRVLDALGQCAIPVSTSDAQLPPNLRNAPFEICESGLAPLSDCYLRFRLGRSNIERFLHLIDCFEVIVKVCATTLIAANRDRIESYVELERPTLGDWISMLRRMVASNTNSQVEAICDFWQQPLKHAPLNLIDLSNGAGLAWKAAMPRSHLDWLAWLVWLRNRTRGHGVVAEEAVAPIWQGFHEALLDVVNSLRSLFLDAELGVVQDSGEFYSLKGWLRGDSRSNARQVEEGETRRTTGFASLRLSESTISLAPFVMFMEEHCLVWNRGVLKKAELVNYSTGRIERYDLFNHGLADVLDVNDLWTPEEHAAVLISENARRSNSITSIIEAFDVMLPGIAAERPIATDPELHHLESIAAYHESYATFLKADNQLVHASQVARLAAEWIRIRSADRRALRTSVHFLTLCIELGIRGRAFARVAEDFKKFERLLEEDPPQLYMTEVDFLMEALDLLPETDINEIRWRMGDEVESLDLRLGFYREMRERVLGRDKVSRPNATHEQNRITEGTADANTPNEHARHYEMRGDDYRSLGQWALSLSSYLEAVRLRKEMFERNAGDTKLASRYAGSLERAGDARKSLNEFPEALEHYIEAALIRGNLSALQPKEGTFAQGVAESHVKMGNVFFASGRIDEALDCYGKALSCWEVISATYPELAEARWMVAASILKCAAVEQDANVRLEKAYDLLCRMEADQGLPHNAARRTLARLRAVLCSQ